MDTITKEEVAGAFSEWVEANSNWDFERLWRFEASGIGFGYRTAAARRMGSITEDDFRRVGEEAKGRMNRYRMETETLRTAVDGDLGLAWGWYVEDFQEKGLPPERARVRFTQAMRKDADGWRVVIFHRDIQPYAEDGQYPRSLTAVEEVP